MIARNGTDFSSAARDDAQQSGKDKSGFNFSAANGVGYLPITVGTINGVTMRVVDGHVLQAFLGSTIDFQVWFMIAVSRARLKRERDYQKAGPPRVNQQTGRSGLHVVFSTDAVKEIAMMASGAQGKAIRQLFIKQAERRINGQPPLPFFAEMQH